MCDCGGVTIKKDGVGSCSLCFKEIDEKADLRVFSEFGVMKLTEHGNLSLSIRDTAARMFELAITFVIKRGAPRIGLSGACIHLASIHHDYPIMVSAIKTLLGKQQKYITNELKFLQKMLTEFHLDYDIIITDAKYINRYLMDVAKHFAIDAEPFRLPLTNIIYKMNDMDLLIENHASTRICCVLFQLLKRDANGDQKIQAITPKEFCALCEISRNTFNKFCASLTDNKDLLGL
jgi:hypothetical protein